MTISIISAVSRNGVIGSKGTLPWHFPSDLKFFNLKTKNKPVIMGRKTFESSDIPKPLPNRRNIIITRDKSYVSPYNIEIVHSLQEALDLFKDSTEEVFILGGTEIYREALKIADKLYMTLIDADYEGDTFFPPFDQTQFIILSENSLVENGTRLSFIEAIRK
jgi:dihydrofolate reductase